MENTEDKRIYVITKQRLGLTGGEREAAGGGRGHCIMTYMYEDTLMKAMTLYVSFK